MMTALASFGSLSTHLGLASSGNHKDNPFHRQCADMSGGCRPKKSKTRIYSTSSSVAMLSCADLIVLDRQGSCDHTMKFCCKDAVSEAEVKAGMEVLVRASFKIIVKDERGKGIANHIWKKEMSSTPCFRRYF